MDRASCSLYSDAMCQEEKGRKQEYREREKTGKKEEILIIIISIGIHIRETEKIVE